jgi:hypothetical protein
MTIDRSASVQLAQATTPSTATSASEKDAIHAVLSGYYDAFGRDSAAASAFYAEPTLIVFPNQIVGLSTRAEVEAFFDKLVASLKPSGFSHSELADHCVKLLNLPVRCGAMTVLGAQRGQSNTFSRGSQLKISGHSDSLRAHLQNNYSDLGCGYGQSYIGSCTNRCIVVTLFIFDVVSAIQILPIGGSGNGAGRPLGAA